MEILENLRKIGLTGNESKVYLELTKRDSLSANDLAKKVGLDRTLTYQLLNSLIEKGLVGYIIKDRKKYFQVSNLKSLLNRIDEQKEIAESLIVELKKIKKDKEKDQ